MRTLTSKGGTRAWRRICEVVLYRDRFRCQMVRDGHLCGAPADTVNHIVRREHGGTDALANLQAACGPCNYGERPPSALAAVRPSARQVAIARALDAAGLPISAGRRSAVPVLARLHPAVTFSSRDIDGACRWRRHRGPLIRA